MCGPSSGNMWATGIAGKQLVTAHQKIPRWWHDAGQVLPQGWPQIPALLQPRLRPACTWLSEWRNYPLQIPGADRLRIGTEWLSPLAGHLFLLRLENRVGLCELQPFTGDLALGEAVWVEVLSTKLPTPGQHLVFLEGLLDDLFARASRLPFALGGLRHRSSCQPIDNMSIDDLTP